MTLDDLVELLVGGGTLTGATLSRPRAAGPDEPRRITVQPVTLRSGSRWGVRRHYGSRTTDENLDGPALDRLLRRSIGTEYRQAILHAPDADWQVLAGRGDPRILRRPPTRPSATGAHDRAKRHVLPEGEPVPFLVELGVQTPDGRVRAQRRSKFRQVNRFVELVEDVVRALPAGRLARRLGAAGLRFEVGDIAEADLEGVDLVVSLHACDTATDAALERAVRARAAVILAVPCCQHELLGQLENNTLSPLLRYGTLRERFVADVTDAARARLLELAGYDVQVVEFVPLEHTPKNILLRATRTERPGRDRDRLAADYRAFADALGIEPALERLLSDLVPSGR